MAHTTRDISGTLADYLRDRDRDALADRLEAAHGPTGERKVRWCSECHSIIRDGQHRPGCGKREEAR